MSIPRTISTFHSAGLISLLEAGGMPRERIVDHLNVAPQLVSEWAEAIEPMPVDEYTALLALLTDMIHDVEAVVADAEASCNVETARGGAVWLAAARALLAAVDLA
jgi:hypothetical protein